MTEPRDDAACPAEHDLLPLATGDAEHAASGSWLVGHVEACPSCKARLARLRSSVTELRQLPRPLRDEPTGQAPSAIGKYRVVGLLGTGGQAEVYRVVHPALEKELVLKLARRRIVDNPSTRVHLAEEAKLLSELDHPGFARVYDLDIHEGRPFLVLELVRGRNLAQVARDESLPPRRAAALVALLARAMGAAHRRGIVHQDLKPENIVIAEDGHPRIIDFGLARVRHAWASVDDGPDTVSGTVPFMAPEQARGDTARIGPRTDVFALGSVLYFLLTGKAPFDAETLELALERAGRCDFDRSALRARGVPPRLERACLRAMEALPEDRQQRTEDLARDLERFARWPRALAAVVLPAGILAAFLGVALWARFHEQGGEGDPGTAPAPGAGIQLAVARGADSLRLADALPLRTGDDLQVRFEVPRGLEVSLFWLDTEGVLHDLPCVEVPAPGPNRLLVHPRPGFNIPLEGPPGTELIVACARPREAPRREEVSALLLPGGPWPALPPSTLVRMDREGPRLQGQRGPGAPKAAANSALRRAEELWQELEKTFEWAAALGFPHDG